MVVTVVCDVLGEENNGTTIAAYHLIRSLRAKGHTVRVVCPDGSKAGQEGYYIVPTYNVGPLNGYVEKNGVSLAKGDTAVLEEALTGCDVVHIMIPLALGFAAKRMALKMDLPMTAGFHCQAENMTSHVFLKDSPFANHLTYRFYYRHLYRYCDAVHYPTQFICDLFENATGPTNHYVISNGVSREFTRRAVQRPAEWEGKYLILFTGRYSKEKSHHLLLEGVAKSKYRDRIQLILAGQGPLADKLRSQSEKLGISMPVMQFYGRSELIDVINMADLYCHAAEIEIEAISCLEAIACGKVPVINDSPRSATRFFALDENNLFRCNDTDDLARKIDFWIEHEELKKDYEHRYLGFAKNFDFDTCMDRMEQMLLDAVANHGK